MNHDFSLEHTTITTLPFYKEIFLETFKIIKHREHIDVTLCLLNVTIYILPKYITYYFKSYGLLILQIYIES